MAKLADVLRQFEGKQVSILVNRAAPVEMGGVVHVEGDVVRLISERTAVPTGQPMMDPKTNQVVQPRAIVPRSEVFLGEMDLSEVVSIRVFLETLEEAKRGFESDQPRVVGVEMDVRPRSQNIFKR